MPPPAINPKNQAAAREYLSNCAFLHQLSVGNKNIDRRIIARAEEYRMMEQNARYLTKFRFATMKKLLDELAALLVVDSHDAVAIAVSWLTQDKIQLLATVNSGEDVDSADLIDEKDYPGGYAAWQSRSIEQHADTIFRLAHDYLATPDPDSQIRTDIESEFRLLQVQHSLPLIIDLFDRLQRLLDDINLLNEDFFRPEYFEDLKPTKSERYFVDELPSFEYLQDNQLASRLSYICLESPNSPESVKARLRSKKKPKLRVLTADNFHVWHELFSCAFVNARLALVKADEYRADDDYTKFTEMTRVLCVYLDYIDAFTNKSRIFREYSGIVMKHAVYNKQRLDLQAKGFNLEAILPLDASTVQIKKENREAGEEKPHNIGAKARHVFQQILSGPKSMLSTFRHKATKTELEDKEDNEQETRSSKNKRNNKQNCKLKTENKLFQSCHLISTAYRRPDNFLRYVIDAEQLTQRQTTLKVIRTKKQPSEIRRGEKLERSLHKFLHLNHLTESEVSTRVQSFLSFLHVIVSNPQRCQHLLSTLNDDNPTFPPLHHPELVLLAYLGPSPQLAYPYIGVSRPPCVVCEHLIIRQRTLEVREGSGKVFAVTIPGRILQKDKDFVYNNIEDLTARIVNDIQTTQRNLNEQYPEESRTGAHAAFPGDELENFPTDSRIENIEEEEG
ncbi:hypothetical protein TWF506_009247 [Arthrobotrys conoides]|uniref:Uncharacterized protein n=1 Tax=Arthrobotrys conoides TaxID=74498 RepID=A0AAN8NN86_9PEZI